MSARRLLSKQDCDIIVKTIQAAELATSGEIRVHIERNCKGPAIKRAITVFNALKMYKTALRNGVLVYLATNTRVFAIIGDSGIHAVVPPDFWDNIQAGMQEAFARGDFVGGICSAVERVGIKLKNLFPYQQDDINEQPDEISFG